MELVKESGITNCLVSFLLLHFHFECWYCCGNSSIPNYNWESSFPWCLVQLEYFPTHSQSNIDMMSLYSYADVILVLKLMPFAQLNSCCENN